jgi:hypothetical protein
MPDEPPQNHLQQFEQTIATIFTCRSIIKYNSALTEEQRDELLADIDTASRFLQDRLIANAAIEAKTVLPQLQRAGILPSEDSEDNDDKGDNEDDEDNGEVNNKDNSLQILRALSRTYQTYLSTKQGNATDTFAARFNEVMTAINEVDRIVEKSHDVYPSRIYVEDLLHRVRGFIADVYYSFKEFVNVISKTLQESQVEIDTEELSSTQRYHQPGEESPRNIAPLVEAYQAHQQLNERKGLMANRVSDATLFLVFLEESLGSDLKKSDELTAQLNEVTKLLDDLCRLLSGYENAIAGILGNGVLKGSNS